MSNRSLRSPGTSHEPDNLPPRFRREVDYYLLNDGSDEEAVPEDRLPKVPRLDSESTIDGSILEDTSVAGKLPNKHALATIWFCFLLCRLFVCLSIRTYGDRSLLLFFFYFRLITGHFFQVIRCKVPKCVKKLEPKSYLAEPRTGRESRAL
ncbi:hypothetical protein POJ06DRAFT_247639 [Lipomyces tetrasporus]|uniref:Uncharacterized protein n=1 Tax=Lipomyces tetrasporus TaxID=54092 RepID=A0AAD7VT06_9ASCO|nr:uncharacterized protein POJ06DRAFT_247639 [Lipomyces tetrasporus]KAJ8101692.1 hypothetical protein POJ06DRAFT_247639 [Lipomyces tetrasporus]